MKQSFAEFMNEVHGYRFYKKGTNIQVFRWEMYWSGLTAGACFKKYDVKEIPILHIY